MEAQKIGVAWPRPEEPPEASLAEHSTDRSKTFLLLTPRLFDSPCSKQSTNPSLDAGSAAVATYEQLVHRRCVTRLRARVRESRKFAEGWSNACRVPESTPLQHHATTWPRKARKCSVVQRDGLSSVDRRSWMLLRRGIAFVGPAKVGGSRGSAEAHGRLGSFEWPQEARECERSKGERSFEGFPSG